MENSEEIEARLAAVEARLASLETEPPTPKAPETTAASGDVFWALDGLRERVEGNGGIVFAGTVQVGDSPVEWQYGLGTDQVLELDWTALAGDLAALGSPVRLSLLQAILSGTKTVADLAAIPGMGSAGQLYHHLNQLAAHGWLTSQSRGSYAVPAPRVVPLMVIMTAAGRTT